MNPATKYFGRAMSAFPGLRKWLRLPGLVGWLGISAGIASGACMPLPCHFASILYNSVFVGAIVLSLVAGLLCSSIPVRFVSFFVAGIACFYGAIAIQEIEYSSCRPLLAGNVRSQLSGAIVSTPTLSNGYYVFQVKSDSVFVKGSRGALRHRIVECRSFQEPCVSGKVVLRGKFSPPHLPDNPFVFDDYVYCLSRGVWGRFYADSIVESRENAGLLSPVSRYAHRIVHAAAASVRNSDYRAIIVASFLNDRSDITEDAKSVFLKAGIYHLLALSGFNIAIVSAALLALLFALPVPREIKVVLVLVCIWTYLLIIGPIPSLLRAVVMTSVVLISFLVQRRSRMLNSLGVAGIVWLLFSPLSLITPGYQLSFGATAGIGILYPFFVRSWKALRKFQIKRLVTFALTPAFVSFAAFFSTAPILLWHFGTISLAGILVNLFAISLMSISMWCSMVGFLLQIVCPQVTPWAMMAAEKCVDIMMNSAGLLSSVRFATVDIPRLLPAVYALFAVFLVGLCAIRQGLVRRYILMAGGIVAISGTALFAWQWSSTPAQMVLFHVKKSCLTAIRWSNRTTWLTGFDGGGITKTTYDRIVAPWLRSFPGSGITAIILADNPDNSVQAIEPTLQNNRVASIVVPTCFAAPGPDFQAFAREYGVQCVSQKCSWAFAPAPGCSIAEMDHAETDHCNRFHIKVRDAIMVYPDSFSLPSDVNGAVEVTFCSGKAPISHNVVPSWNPLARAMAN